jgi:SAM-dependent methyltransferase
METAGALLPEGGRLLDAGCGPGLRTARRMAREGRTCVGVDVGDLERGGPGLHAVRSDLNALGLASGAFDVAVLRSVTEHLAAPAGAFAEIARVLRPGGSALILSPNRWHYASVAGRILPEGAARRLLRFIFGETVYDNFPTYYRANTRRAVRRLAEGAGLEVAEAAVCEHPPDYLKFSPALFRIGILYDRLTSRVGPLTGLAVSYLFVLRKPGPAGAGRRAADEPAPEARRRAAGVP